MNKKIQVRAKAIVIQDAFLDKEGLLDALIGIKLYILNSNPFCMEYGLYVKDNKVYNDKNEVIKELNYLEEKALDNIENLLKFVRSEYKNIWED